MRGAAFAARSNARVGYDALMDEGQTDAVVGNANATRPGGITGRGFMPGRSGNPKGSTHRQKGLAALVRRSTKQGKELVGFMVDVARGKFIKISVTTLAGTVVEVERRATVRDRMEAVAWLADRGWGKAKEVIQLEGERIAAPVQIVILGDGGDPLARPERPPARRVIEARALPPSPEPRRAEPPPARPAQAESGGEVGFTMEPE